MDSAWSPHCPVHCPQGCDSRHANRDACDCADYRRIIEDELRQAFEVVDRILFNRSE